MSQLFLLYDTFMTYAIRIITFYVTIMIYQKKKKWLWSKWASIQKHSVVGIKFQKLVFLITQVNNIFNSWLEFMCSKICCSQELGGITSSLKRVLELMDEIDLTYIFF